MIRKEPQKEREREVVGGKHWKIHKLIAQRRRMHRASSSREGTCGETIISSNNLCSI